MFKRFRVLSSFLYFLNGSNSITSLTLLHIYFIFFKDTLFSHFKDQVSALGSIKKKKTISGSLTHLNKCPNSLFLFYNSFIPLVYVPFTKLKMNFQSFGENLSAQATCSRQLCVEPYLLLLDYNIAFLCCAFWATQNLLSFWKGCWWGSRSCD